MTLHDWDCIIAGMTRDDIARQITAIDSLADWQEFRKEWSWTGIFTLKVSLENEQRKRQRTYKWIERCGYMWGSVESYIAT